eukprot:5330339-Karenia_brevis.AAC.1
MLCQILWNCQDIESILRVSRCPEEMLKVNQFNSRESCSTWQRDFRQVDELSVENPCIKYKSQLVVFLFDTENSKHALPSLTWNKSNHRGRVQ